MNGPADSPDRATRRPRRRGARASERDTLRGRVRAHDPFELIRWLALSQPDPRKALAELVQNSLDAGAKRIRVTRVREKGVLCLRILDDGDGVIPELDRPEALRYIATHIGHSRKRDLSPQERMTLMTQGQYGIGLLGCWSLGEMLEMRSAVPGQRTHRLVLHRDQPDFTIEPLRGRLALEERWTEIVIVGLHREASTVLAARRAADYLALELRGQLLAREVELVIEDRVSRGRAEKVVAVRPPRFLGERLEGLGPVAVPGFPPIRLEIYLASEDGSDGRAPGLAVYAAGTQVAEGFHDLDALGLDRAPWNDRRLTGLVDFPGFRVAPGSRRGVVLDEAAGGFAQAIVGVEPILNGILDSFERQRAAEMDRGLIRDLQRAFRDFYRRSPRYAMLPVSVGTAAPSGGEDAGEGMPANGAPADLKDGNTGGASDDGRDEAGSDATGREDQVEPGADRSTAGVPEDASRDTDLPPSPAPPSVEHLFPPGPLASVSIVPSRLRLRVHATRELRAEALDRDGRLIRDPVEFAWSVRGPIGVCREEAAGGARIVFAAASEPAEGTLSVCAQSGDRLAEAEAEVEVVEELARSRAAEGIPEPEFVHQVGAAWRSRMEESRWQVNSGHRDFRDVEERPALKLRYLACCSRRRSSFAAIRTRVSRSRSSRSWRWRPTPTATWR